MQKPNPEQNTGVLWRDPQPEDDMASGNTRVESKEIVPDGIWVTWNPAGYWQVGLYGDTSGCTNFACTHSICMQINRMIANNEIPPETMQKLTRYGFIVNGKFSASPRYNYIKSGTRVGVGNYLYKPWDSLRHDGIVPYEMLPFPYRQQNPPFTIAMYADPKSITPEMDELAKIFTEIFLVQYDVVSTDDASQALNLKTAPLAIITGVCKPWDGSVIEACAATWGHAMCRNGLVEGKERLTFDSYEPNQKRFAWSYSTGYAIRGVVTLRGTKWTHKFFQNMAASDYANANPIDEVKALQIALFLDGISVASEWTTQEQVQKWGGFFGQETTRGVKEFQKKYGIIQTGRVGSLTNAKLNELFNF